tara:strand:+ start:557 stop:1957 length:1401 start_codon:yes stop_codon:yes gene_type:complete
VTPTTAPARLERWLGHWPSRLILILALVVLASAMDTSSRLALLDQEVTLTQWLESARWPLLRWSLWALAALLVVPLGLFLIRKLPHPALFLIAQLPVSYGIAYGVTDLHYRLTTSLLDSPGPGSAFGRGFRAGGENERRGEGRRRRPTEDANMVQGEPPAPQDADASSLEPTVDVRQEGARQDGTRWNNGERPLRPSDPGFWDVPRIKDRYLRRALPFEMGAYWMVLLMGIAANTYLRSRREERRAGEAELRATKLETELLEAQLSSLESQLRPHFLFNALHSVSGLIRLGDTDKARAALTALGDLLRATLDQSGERTVLLADEIAIARHYLAVESIRYGDRLVIREELTEELLDTQVPALLLLPLVENAVRHAVASRTEPVTLTIEARSRGVNLEINVIDDGPPFPAAILTGGLPENGGGIGIANTRARLKNLFGDKARLELENPPQGGALVRALIPLRRTHSHD